MSNLSEVTDGDVQGKLLSGETPTSVYAGKNYGRGSWRVYVTYPGLYEFGLSAARAETAAATLNGQGLAHVARKLQAAARDVRELNGGLDA